MKEGDKGVAWPLFQPWMAPLALAARHSTARGQHDRTKRLRIQGSARHALEGRALHWP